MVVEFNSRFTQAGTLDGGSIAYTGDTVIITEYVYGPRMGVRTIWTTTIPLSEITYITYRKATFWIQGWIIVATPGKEFKLRMGLSNRDFTVDLLNEIITAKSKL